MAYMNVKDLSVGYNRVPLIKDIDFTIEKGEIVVLIGPNGAGKSTILKSITRHLKTLKGVVTVEEQNLFHMSAHKLARTMSVVLTDRIRPELMTCRDVVAMGRYPYTGGFGRLTKKDEEILEDALRKVDALELADRNFNELSDGQRQRIMLARAICQQPDIMVLDEPTSFLDIRYKVDLLNILRQMASEGMTIILSLHEIELAAKLADKVICVKGDHISLVGTPREVFAGEHIAEIFEIEGGCYDPMSGSVELKKPAGEPDVLIIGGSGTGIEVYRHFQKQGIPFYAGLLFANDVELPVARALAREVIAAEAFTPVSPETEQKLKDLAGRVSRVIDCGCRHGVFDQINADVIEAARAAGKLEVI